MPEIPAPPPGILGWRGHALRLFTNPVRHLTRLRDQYGEIVGLCRSSNPPLLSPGLDGIRERTLVIFGAQANRQVLLRPDVFETRAPRQPSGAPQRLSNNVIFMNGAQHSHRRRLLMKGLSQANVKRLHDEEVVRLCQGVLCQWEVGDTLNLFEQMRQISLQVASKCFLGLEAGSGASSLAQDMRSAITMMFSPSTLLPIDLPGSPQWRLRRRMELIESRLLTEIDRRRQQGDDGADLLSQLLRASETGETVTRQELAGQAFVLFFAGHDTTTCGLTWTLFLLAQHPHVANLVHDELAQLGGVPPAFEKLGELSELDRVIKESLRLFPPGMMFGRVCVRDTEILGYPVASGTEVLYSPYVTHRDPHVFEHPHLFLPDRWKTIAPDELEYLPFGSGVRRCIGGNFAVMELRSILAQVLQRFRVRLVDRVKLDALVNPVLAPRQEIRVVLEPLDAPGHAMEISGQVREMVGSPPPAG